METENKSVSSLTIKENVQGKVAPSFLEYFEDHIKELESKKKFNSFRPAKSVYTKLKKYLKGRDLTFEEVDYHFLKKYEHYLRNKLGNTTNTVHANLKVIRKLMNAAVREEIIEPGANPFPRYKLSWENTTKAYLTEEEINLIETLQLPEDQVINHHRNLYIFAAYAGGLRISDLLQLKWQNFNGSPSLTVLSNLRRHGFSGRHPSGGSLPATCYVFV